MFIKNDPYKQLNNDISELKSVELELKHRIDELNTQLRDTTEELKKKEQERLPKI